MRHIYQRCESDCFPTCIAIVAGISHYEAVRRVHPFHKKGTEYATTDDKAIQVLRNLGFKVRKRYYTSFWDIEETAILIVRFQNENKDNYHVVVWDPVEKKILEPYRKYRTVPLYLYEKAFEYALLVTK